MYIEDKIKTILNLLQYHLTKDSEKILLIFDTRYQLEGYRKHKKAEQLKNEILITYMELLYKGKDCLTGRRFKSYWFMTDDDLLEQTKE